MAAEKLTINQRQELYKRMSKFFEDVAKLVIAGVVIGSLMQQQLNPWLLLAGGGAVTVTLVYLSYKAFLKSGNGTK